MRESTSDLCPITFEAFTEQGPLQPRILPVCGHTFSRVSLEKLLRAKENRLPVTEVGNKRLVGVSPLACPLCMQPQKKARVRSVDDCPPNWQLIHRLREAREDGVASVSNSQKSACTHAELQYRRVNSWRSVQVSQPEELSCRTDADISSTSHAQSTQTV